MAAPVAARPEVEVVEEKSFEVIPSTLIASQLNG